jgi:hypothetical protein
MKIWCGSNTMWFIAQSYNFVWNTTPRPGIAMLWSQLRQIYLDLLALFYSSYEYSSSFRAVDVIHPWLFGMLAWQDLILSWICFPLKLDCLCLPLIPCSCDWNHEMCFYMGLFCSGDSLTWTWMVCGPLCFSICHDVSNTMSGQQHLHNL